MNKINHAIPEKYHELFYIGTLDRRGNIIDFKIPPVIVDSLIPMDQYKKIIFDEHISAELLPLVHTKAERFIILRPTALVHRVFVREQLIEFGLKIQEEFELDNFMQFADILYLLDSEISFHWKWRVIMRSLHDTGIQDQNKAIVFILENQECNDMLMDIKKNIRTDMGETPVLVRYNGTPEIALGIHHLHSPDLERLTIEYNVLMHARYKTSVFG